MRRLAFLGLLAAAGATLGCGLKRASAWNEQPLATAQFEALYSVSPSIWGPLPTFDDAGLPLLAEAWQHASGNSLLRPDYNGDGRVDFVELVQPGPPRLELSITDLERNGRLDRRHLRIFPADAGFFRERVEVDEGETGVWRVREDTVRPLAVSDSVKAADAGP